jgi:glycosyltransferase involved in cell wall biosynthesis
MTSAAIAIVAPDLTSRITGGNLVDRALLDALGPRARRIAPEALGADAERAAPTAYLVDSLCLEALEVVLERARHRAWLLAHLLPSQDPGAGEVRRALERRVLPRLDGAIAFSGFMRDALIRGGVAAVRVVEPAPPAWARPLERAGPGDPPRLLVVGNRSPIKGVDGLLDALAVRLRPDDRFALRLVGDDATEADAARLAERLARPALAGRVVVIGPLAHDAMRAEYRAADLVVSPARLETYGLALAEARACGVPLAVLDGGNAAAHVARETGEVAADHAALADRVLALVRRPAELSALGAAARWRAGRDAARPRPSWADVADAVVSHLGGAP